MNSGCDNYEFLLGIKSLHEQLLRWNLWHNYRLLNIEELIGVFVVLDFNRGALFLLVRWQKWGLLLVLLLILLLLYVNFRFLFPFLFLVTFRFLLLRIIVCCVISRRICYLKIVVYLWATCSSGHNNSISTIDYLLNLFFFYLFLDFFLPLYHSLEFSVAVIFKPSKLIYLLFTWQVTIDIVGNG